MTTQEYENEIPAYYYLRVEGYNNITLEKRRHSRQDAYIGLMGQVDLKKLSFRMFCEEIYPLPRDEFEEPETIMITPEEMIRLQEIHSKPLKRKLK